MNIHVDGTKPKSDQIFVFGSNLAGFHGAGAAKFANIDRGLRYGHGATGWHKDHFTYGIPTKNQNIQTMHISEIKPYIDQFVTFTRHYPDLSFFLTTVGCGLAGFKHEKMAPLFWGLNPDNCSIPDVWAQYL